MPSRCTVQAPQRPRPQPYFVPGRGFLFLHTKYGGGRRLFQMSSPDGRTWTEPEMLAHIEMGHYQISWHQGDKVGTAFNFHPKPKGLNWRTNLYYMETDDFGRTWRNVQGEAIELPLARAGLVIAEQRSESDGGDRWVAYRLGPLP